MFEHLIEQLVICFNAVAPFFLVMGLGWLAVRRKLVGDKFIAGLNKLIFTYLFPANLFAHIYRADLAYAFDPALAVFFIVSISVLYLLVWAIGARVLTKPKLGAFVQAVYRSNYVILSIPIILLLFGEYALPKTALMVPFVVATNAILATVIFIVNGENSGLSGLAHMKNVLLGILKTPMIIGVAIGVLANLAGLSLPLVLSRGIGSVADMAAPAALIGIGGVLSLEKVRRHFKFALAAALLKNVLVPLWMIIPAVLLGFRGAVLAIIAMIGLAPTAAVSYATAVEMGGDGDATVSCLVLSNAAALFTIVPGLAVLGAMGLF